MVESREIIENGVKLGKIENTEAKKSNPKRKERETHIISYQRKSHNPSYSQQQNHAYQPYNQYAANIVQENYQPNFRPVTRFPALPAPT